MACTKGLAVALALGLIPAAAACGETAHQPLPAQAAAPGWNWGDDPSTYYDTQSPEFAASKAICRRLRTLEPPASDWPDAATASTLRGCDSDALYYGIGIPAAPARARQCALLQARRFDRNGGAFAGIGMLMTIYANGVGAERDLDLATSLACRIQGAPAENNARADHLQSLKATHWTGTDFNYCDDTTSGYSGGVCAVQQASIADVARSDKLDALTSGWSKPEQQAFASLRTSAAAYAKASSENEVDLTGTLRVALMIDREQDVMQEFLDLLGKLEHGGLPAGSVSGMQTVDASLNDVYRRLMAVGGKAGPGVDYGTVTKSGIRQAERAWLHYRNAWAGFAQVRYPKLAAGTAQIAVTRQRFAYLKQFLPQPAPATSR